MGSQNWASHVFFMTALIWPFVSCFCFWFALMLICFILGHTRCLQLIRYLPVCVINFFLGGVAFHRHHYRWNQCLHFCRRSRFRKCSGFLSRLYFLFSFLRIATKNKLKLCSEKQSWAQIRLLRNKRRKNRGGGFVFGEDWVELDPSSFGGKSFDGCKFIFFRSRCHFPDSGAVSIVGKKFLKMKLISASSQTLTFQLQLRDWCYKEHKKWLQSTEEWIQALWTSGWPGN